MHFELPLTLVQFFIPSLCAGILVGGLFLYGYMALSYRSPLYTRLSLLALFAIGFVGSEMFILGFGGWRHNWQLSIHFHQVEHLSGAFFIFALPFYLEQILDLGTVWKKINKVIWSLGLVFAFSCVVLTFIKPDLFISSTVHKGTWLRYEADYGRGLEGVLYYLRDLFLFVVIVYSLASIVHDLRKNRRFEYLIFPIVGILLAITGAAIDIGFVYTGVNFDFFPHTYFSRFSLGITLLIVTLMSGLTRHFVELSKDIERANINISISEEKYRVLVEGTNDLIFTLDANLHFLSANRATEKHFGLSEEQLFQKSFLDLILYDKSSRNVEKNLIIEKIHDLEKRKRPVTFKAAFVSEGSVEPKEFEIRLEYINIEGKNEIIGKASFMTDNALMKYLESETQNYTIGNYLIAAEEISKRLVQNLHKYINPHEIIPLRIGLREIIINAIEHGNLNVSFDEKSEVSMREDYMQFIASRQKDPKYMDRRVMIRFSLNAQRVIYIIEDEGDGFDYRNILSRIKTANTEELSHGRGLTMALGAFDVLRFNDKGNRVYLARKFCEGEYEFEEAI